MSNPYFEFFFRILAVLVNPKSLAWVPRLPGEVAESPSDQLPFRPVGEARRQLLGHRRKKRGGLHLQPASIGGF